MAKTTSLFTSIAIIYNPISTGPGKQMAEELMRAVLTALPDQAIELVETKRAGHAEELAYKIAKQSATPLIISASGDGGYNEVVNGLMKAQAEGAKPVAGLLPSGNANDHFNDVYQEDVAASIQAGKTQCVDLLTLNARSQGKPLARYAHSYIGFGLTPMAGKELNKRSLNRINEIGVVLNVLLFLRPVKLVLAGRTRYIDSLVFSNIARMSKVLQLSEKAKSDDGKFEVTVFYRRNKFQLIKRLVTASTTGLKGNIQYTDYAFKTVSPTLTQMDGEIYRLDAQSKVEIGIEHQKLTCLY